MHARLDHRLAAALRGEAGLDRGEDLVVGQRERRDVGPVEVVEIELVVTVHCITPALMFASFTILLHFAVSLLIIAANSAGVLAIGFRAEPGELRLARRARRARRRSPSASAR